MLKLRRMGTYSTNSQIRFKTSMLKSRLCDYSDAYILMSVTITVTTLAAGNVRTPKIKNFAPLTDCRNETNRTQVDNARDIDIVMPIFNLIKYSNVYLETSGSLWQYYRNKLYLDPGCDSIVDLLVLNIIINRLNINKK